MGSKRVIVHEERLELFSLEERRLRGDLIQTFKLLTYLSPWLLLEHRPCTTSLQRLLSWAILSSCFQLSPVCVMSASRSRRQVFFSLPLFRLPWGFHAAYTDTTSLTHVATGYLSQCIEFGTKDFLYRCVLHERARSLVPVLIYA